MAKVEELKKDMEKAKELCKKFESLIETEMAKGTEQIDTHELGEVVDMMKDCAEIVEKKAKAAYYCSVVKAMEDSEEEDEMIRKMSELNERRGYGDYREPYNPMSHDRPDYMYYGGGRMPRMYYDGGSSSSGQSSGGSSMSGSGSSRMYSESNYDRARRGYTESRDIHNDDSVESKEANMRKLEAFLKTVEDDVMELKPKMSQEERTLAKSKLATWASKL